MFCSPGPIFDGTEDVGNHFHVLFPGPIFVGTEGAPGLVFMFCAPVPVFDVIEDAGSRFHVLRFQTHFQRYRGRRVPFSCFALSDPFSTVSRASGSIFMFCAPALVSVFGAPGHVLGHIEGVRSRIHVSRSRTCLRRCRGSRVPFSCFTLPDLFWAVGGRLVSFSCFALQNLFSAVPRAPGPVFMFCALETVFGRSEVIGSYFYVLHSWTRFRR
jgi:hypothetical protein